MACHYPPEVGHTLPEVGAEYVQFQSERCSAPWHRYKLRSFNEATGMATLQNCRHGWAGRCISLTALSLWYRVPA